jgi:hypothetical protein
MRELSLVKRSKEKNFISFDRSYYSVCVVATHHAASRSR